jgi:hypothetical protein
VNERQILPLKVCEFDHQRSCALPPGNDLRSDFGPGDQCELSHPVHRVVSRRRGTRQFRTCRSLS